MNLSYQWLGVLILGAIVSVIWFFLLPGSWTNPLTYGAIYHVDSSKVQWHDKPTGCHFMHPPLGDKGCHYKKVVRGYNNAGAVVAGDNAPKWAVNSEKKPLVSYDNGKSWQLIPEGQKPDTKVVTVEIDWEKVTE